MKNFFLTTFIFLTEASKSHNVMDDEVNMPKMIQKVKLQKIAGLIDAWPNSPLSAPARAIPRDAPAESLECLRKPLCNDNCVYDEWFIYWLSDWLAQGNCRDVQCDLPMGKKFEFN